MRILNFIFRPFCMHEFKKTGRGRGFLIFFEDEWKCKHCGKRVDRFVGLDPNIEIRKYGRN